MSNSISTLDPHQNPVFTVFTPTYQRARLLPRLYSSLQAQTFRSFEWLIVDDGSTDGTAEVIAPWIESSSFPIRYEWKENGGKHTAINWGVKKARGFFFAIMDSDDWYAPAALELLFSGWRSIPEVQRARYAGVCAHFADTSGVIVGTRFPSDALDSDDIDLRIRYRVRGDKLGMIRLDIMREYPFPEDLGRFVTESLVWNRIGLRYLTRFVNEVVGYKEYLPGGLTDSGRWLQHRNSKASRQYHFELISAGRKLPNGMAIRSYANFIRHSLHEGICWKDQVRCVPSRWMWTLCLPMGVYLARRDRRMPLR